MATILTKTFFLCGILAIVFAYNPSSRNGRFHSVPAGKSAGPRQQPLVRFNSNGTLKIVQFADLHYGEGPNMDWGPENDIKSTRVISDILEMEKPDFVIFTGDQISGEVMFPNATDYIHLLLKPLVEGGYRVEYVAIQENIQTNHLCNGLVDDTVVPQDNDTHIMDALVEAGGVKTVFVGHDHGNAWCCFHEDVQVCYNKHTGYGGYGSWARGARVIDLDIRNLMNQTNYVRMETGEIVDRFPNEDLLYKEV